MRKSRFTEEQMVAILREAEKSTVAAAAKRNKVSEQTIYAWRQHFAGMEPSDVKKLKSPDPASRRWSSARSRVMCSTWRSSAATAGS